MAQDTTLSDSQIEALTLSITERVITALNAAGVTAQGNQVNAGAAAGNASKQVDEQITGQNQNQQSRQESDDTETDAVLKSITERLDIGSDEAASGALGQMHLSNAALHIAANHVLARRMLLALGHEDDRHCARYPRPAMPRVEPC